jgi:subtilase family serine protease
MSYRYFREDTMRIVVPTSVVLMTFVAASISITSAPAAAAPTFERSCAQTNRPGAMECMALRQTAPAGVSSRAVKPGAKPGGYGPTDLRSAYGVPSGAGGVTVAITDAYDDPHAESDLKVYRAEYGLPACTTANGCFRKVNQKGAKSPLPKADKSWAGEVSLDVDMVSAICPKCHILLLEASSNNDSDLLAAISRAVQMGAKYVSNSWGGDESANQTTLDKQLNHPGVAITVSTGDDGYGTEYPAASRYVTAVGGTTLTKSANSRGWSETVWSGTGSGCSKYDAKPSWQTVTTTCAKRAEADVSVIANPNTGVAVYQTYGDSGWAIYGGTSTGAPIVAAMYALAGKPGAKDYPASYPYAHASHFHDVTSGHNGNCGSRLCGALAGWDGPTGLGTPNGVAGLKASTPAA